MNQTEPSPILDRALRWSIDNTLPPLTRYAAATLLILAIALLRAAFVTILLPWLLFVPAVLVVALLMGRDTGLYGVLLSAVLAGASIATPDTPLWLTGAQWFATVVYVLVASGVVLIAAELRAAFRRARDAIAERDRGHALLLERDQQRELLNGELGHRMKNLIGIIQAVVGQTLRRSPDLDRAGAAIDARLSAIAKASSALTAASWQAADLRMLARDALGTHGERITLDGPDIHVTPQVAMALTMTFHELLTNAIKYGALARDVGSVALGWTIDRANDRFRLSWCERGGPPVEPPTRQGFGSLMIERTLKSYLGGEIAVDYRPDGLVMTIDAPLTGMTVDRTAAP